MCYTLRTPQVKLYIFCAKQRQFFDASIRFKVIEPGGSRFTVHCRHDAAAATSPVAHPMHKARPNGTILKKERKCRQCSVLHNGDKTFLADCCKIVRLCSRLEVLDLVYNIFSSSTRVTKRTRAQKAFLCQRCQRWHVLNLVSAEVHCLFPFRGLHFTYKLCI